MLSDFSHSQFGDWRRCFRPKISHAGAAFSLIEYALLRGILFGAVTSIYLAMAEPSLALSGLLERFAKSAVLFGGLLLAIDLYRRGKIARGDRQ